MSKPVPTPLAAALGLVPTVIDGVRQVPGKVVQLPVLAISSALTALETARKEYDELAGRGEQLVARLRGVSFDDLEDRVEDLLEDTILAAPYDAVEDALEDALASTAAKVGELRDQAPDKPSVERDALPLPDYDHMTLGSLRGRLRSLSVEQLVQVRGYEADHAKRLPVLTLLDNRIAKLSTP